MTAPGGSKQYGLIKPGQAKPGIFTPKPSIFGEDSDSEDEGQIASDWVKKAFQRETEKTTTKRQTKLDMQRALTEDPTIYQYDEVYDKMEKVKMETVAAKKDVERKPKYIAKLLEQAERRKRENERRTERQVQKEREAEGEEFKDKEAFVTASYRAKIEEFNKQDEEERYRDKLEELTDVSKQKDLSGFYRQLYRQTVATESDPAVSTIKQEVIESVEVPESEEVKESLEVEETEVTTIQNPQMEVIREKRERHYRKRKDSDSSHSDTANVDRDADSDLAESSSEDDEADVSKKVLEASAAKKPKLEVEDPQLDQDLDKDDSDSEDEKEEKNNEKEMGDDTPSVDKVEVVKPKINIWLKRTVGELYDSALERYYARKAARC